MIKVPTLLPSGLLAPALLLLASCSGTPTDGTGDEASGRPGPDLEPTVPDAAAEPRQDPEEQDPQDRNQAMVEQSLRKARQALERRLFRDALHEALIALEFDPGNEEARDIVRRVNEILGEGAANIAEEFENRILRDRFAAERERYRVRQEMQLAQAHLDQEQYGQAVERFENAVRMLRFSAIHIGPNDPLVREAEQRLAAAREARQEAVRQQADERETASQAELDRMARERRRARQARVGRFLSEANQAFQFGNYDRAVELCELALQLAPSNNSAQELRELADQARHSTAMDHLRQQWKTEWVRTFDELDHENVPQTETVVFDIERWTEVSQREPAKYAPPGELESPENRAIRKKLEETVLEHRFTSAAVQDWASYYSDVTEITFFVSEEVREGMDAEDTTLTDFSLPRRSVARALDTIRAQTGVAWTVENGMVHLVPPERAGGPAYMQQYSVRDLVFGITDQPGPDLKLTVPDAGGGLGAFGGDFAEPAPAVIESGALEGYIDDYVVATPGGWGASDPGVIQNGVYIVNAEQRVHEHIADILSGLRRHVGIQVDVEARFLQVEDNFLEDVGVDFRGLGNQAAEGVAGRGLEQNNRQNAGFDDFGQTQQINPATPGTVGSGTEPGFFYDDGGDGDYMARTENLFDSTLGASEGEEGLSNAGGLSLQYAFLDDTELEVVLRAVRKQERSEEIEAPRLLIYNNTRSSMSFLRNVSYIRDFEVEIAQAAAVANPVVDVVREGVALDVRPVVDADLKFITMELRPTVMSLQLPIPTFTTTLGVGQPISIQLPNVTRQSVRTTITMPDGGTLMLGGMKLTERTEQVSGVPILKDLPGLSFLFSRKGSLIENKKVLILLRAKIILMEEHMPEITGELASVR